MTLQAGSPPVNRGSFQGVRLPAISRWFIRTALGYLALSFALGILQISSPRGGLILWPTYLHLLVLGWLTQLIFGVALWLFPRQSREPSRSSVSLSWVCYWLLNLGLILRFVGEPARSLGYSTTRLLVWSAALQLVAGWSFVVLVWPRVKER